MTEFAGIADETPEMFGGSGALQQLAGFVPINRVLQRFPGRSHPDPLRGAGACRGRDR